MAAPCQAFAVKFSWGLFKNFSYYAICQVGIHIGV